MVGRTGSGGGGTCDLFIETPLTGCGGLSPGGNMMCQTIAVIPPPPPDPGCTQQCEASNQCVISEEDPTGESSNRNRRLSGRKGLPQLVTLTYYKDAETGREVAITGLVPVDGVLTYIELAGQNLVRANDGGASIADSFGGGGGTVTSGTGEPCNRCPSGVAGTVSSASTVYNTQ